MKRTLAIYAALGLAAAAFAAAEVGKPAPDFGATGIDGKTYQLGDFKGRIVVLESYNLGCPFCANHYKSGAMQELQADLTGKGVVWLMVNSVNPHHPNFRNTEAARKEWADQKMKATAWLDDSSGKIGRAYGMRTTPHMFVIDKAGTLVYDGAIDDQPTPNHDPRKARNYVRDALNHLLAGDRVTVARSKPYGCSVKYAD